MISGNAFAVMVYPIVGIVFFLLWRKGGWSGARVLFTLIFTVYAVEVLKVTLFPLPVDGVMARDFAEIPFWGFLNLVPLGDLTADTLRTQFAPNVLLGVPFGFGAWFVLRRPNLRTVLVLGVVAAIAIELVQLSIGALIGVMYRSIDVNDPIANTIGVLIGIAVFGLFSAAFRSLDGEEPNNKPGALNHVRRVVSRSRENSTYLSKDQRHLQATLP